MLLESLQTVNGASCFEQCPDCSSKTTKYFCIRLRLYSSKSGEPASNLRRSCSVSDKAWQQLSTNQWDVHFHYFWIFFVFGTCFILWMYVLQQTRTTGIRSSGTEPRRIDVGTGEGSFSGGDICCTIVVNISVVQASPGNSLYSRTILNVKPDSRIDKISLLIKWLVEIDWDGNMPIEYEHY